MDIMFDGIEPLAYLYVSPSGSDDADGDEASPLRTIQKAVSLAVAGTAIVVRSGGVLVPVPYSEHVTLTGRNGTPTAPCWLVTKERAVIQPPTQDRSAIFGGGVENWVVAGFEIVGGLYGVQFNDSGGRDVRNVVLYDLHCRGQAKDGIKVSHADDAYVYACEVNDVNEEGIDLLSVHNGLVAYCDVRNARSTAAGIFAKGGSRNVTIMYCRVQGVPSGDGICAGGQTGSQFFRADSNAFEAENVSVVSNHVSGVGKRTVSFKGALSSRASMNRLEGVAGYYASVAVLEGDATPDAGVAVMYSKDVAVMDNLMLANVQVRTHAGSGPVTVSGNGSTVPWAHAVGPANAPRLSLPPLPVPAPEEEENHPPRIVSAKASADVTEWASKSAGEKANTPHVATGSIVVSDGDAVGTLSATFRPRALTGYVGTFSLNSAALASGVLGWTYSVPDSLINALNAGQRRVQQYDVTISDGRGGSALQTVTINLVGVRK